MTNQYRAMYEAVETLCEAVWKGYDEQWEGRYIVRKVDAHIMACRCAIENYCDLYNHDFNRLFNKEFIQLNKTFDKFRDSTRPLFDDIPPIDGEVNRRVFVMGATLWLAEQADEFFDENPILKSDFNNQEA